MQNYLHDKKIKGHVLAEIPKNKIVIFWEQNQLAPAEIAKIKKDCGHLSLRIETFKPQPQIFWFLDSISPNLEKTLELLSRLPEKNTNLIFQFENRMLFLILARLKVKMETAGKIAGLNVLDWQWTKIKRQAMLLNLETLFALYDGILKIDNMTKSGASDLKENTLITVLLLKYLSPRV